MSYVCAICILICETRQKPCKKRVYQKRDAAGVPRQGKRKAGGERGLLFYAGGIRFSTFIPILIYVSFVWEENNVSQSPVDPPLGDAFLTINLQ